MNYVRAQLPKQAPHAGVQTEILSRSFEQFENGNVVTTNAFPKVSRVGQADDGVMELLSRKTIDQVHQAILQPTKIQSENDVADADTTLRNQIPAPAPFSDMTR